jgi:hypothetical protein
MNMRDLRSFPATTDFDRGVCFIAAAVVTAGVVGAGASVIGSSNAANAETNAANKASQTQLALNATSQANLAPFIASGNNATNALQYGLGIGPNNAGLSTGGDTFGSLAAPVTMNEATLQNTPGYQFNLSQGLKAVQNGAAARGLGSSGAALKGAGNFATGLADSTYQNQFNNAVTNQNNTYNRLLGLSSTGESAAAGAGTLNTATGQSIGSNITGAGNATAAADVAGANAVGSAASSIPSSLLTSQFLGQLQGGGLFGSGNAAASQINNAPGIAF